MSTVGEDRQGFITLMDPWLPMAVDIIAVHGLNGHPLTTWTNIEERIMDNEEPQQEPATTPRAPEYSSNFHETLWLKDLLPQQLQPIKLGSLPNIGPQVRSSLELTTGLRGARIRSFGYDCTLPPTSPNSRDRKGGRNAVTLERDLVGNVARELLTAIGTNNKACEDADEAPLVFVAHDLGGLIVKEALWIANTSAEFISVAVRTRVVIFFGTPHSETTTLSWSDLFLNIALASIPPRVTPTSGPTSGSTTEIATTTTAVYTEGCPNASRHAILTTAIHPSVPSSMASISARFARIASAYTIVSVYSNSPGLDGLPVIPASSAIFSPLQPVCKSGDAGYFPKYKGKKIVVHREGMKHWDICKFSRMRSEAGTGDASVIVSSLGSGPTPEGSYESCTDREIVQAFVDIIEESIAGRARVMNPGYIECRKSFTPIAAYAASTIAPILPTFISRPRQMPSSPLETSIGDFERWLQTHPSYCSWRNDGAVLHIHGACGSGKSTAVQSILEHHHNLYSLLPAPETLSPTRTSPLPTLLTYTMPAYPPIPKSAATTSTKRVNLPEGQTPAHVLLCHLISQLILCEGNGVAHVLHKLYRAIRKRRNRAWQVAGFTEEDLWLILDGVLAHRQASNEVIIVLDIDGQESDSLGEDDGMRDIRWVVERLLKRAVEGGSERNRLIKVVLATAMGPEDLMQETTGGLYSTLDFDSLATKEELAKLKSTYFGIQQLADSNIVDPTTLFIRLQVVALIARHASFLDLQLASTLPVTTSTDGLDPQIYSTDPIAYRNTLYSKHYAHLFMTTLTSPLQRLWAYETFGWLLYNAGSTRGLKGISVAEVALAVSLSLMHGRPSPGSQLTGTLHVLPPAFASVQELIIGVLGQTPFVKITSFPSLSTEQDDGNGEQKKIDLAHSSVREFLLRGDTSSTSIPVAPDLRVAPPNFADAVAWHTRLALTCVKFLQMDVKAVMSVTFTEVETHMNKPEGVNQYDEEISGLPAASELSNDEEAEKAEELEAEKAEESEEAERVGESEGGEEGEEPKYLNSEQSGDNKGSIEDSPRHQEENQGPPIIPSLLLRYSILSWPFHVHHSINHQDQPSFQYPEHASTLHKIIKIFLTTNDHLLGFWHSAYSFLARCPTNVVLPLPDTLLHSPLNIACYFGMFPLVQEFVHVATHDNRLTLPDRLLALEVAASNNWAEICGYLLHKRGRTALGIRDFFTPLLFAVRNGHLASTKVFLFGGEEEGNAEQREERGKERCYIIFKSESKHWGYSELVKQAAKNGHINVLKVLLDAIRIMTVAEKEIHVDAVVSGSQSEMAPVYAQLNEGRTEFNLTVFDAPTGTPATSSTVPSPSLLRAIGTPLHHAAKSGFVAIARVLLGPHLPNVKFHIDPAQTDRKNFTPLHYAACKGHLSILKLLLAQPQADVDTTGWVIKPLHLAAGEGYPAVVEELLRFNATAEVFDSDGRSPLHYACLEGHVEVVYQLLTRAEVDASHAESKNGITPLHLATNFGSLAIVDALINSGAEPNARTVDSCSTPLHYAATKGWSRIARRLLECGAACDPKLNENMFTPLHLSVFYGYRGVTHVLIEFGADVKAITGPHPQLYEPCKCWTVLHLALGDVPLTAMLVDAGADPNVVDENDDSPLSILAYSGSNLDAARILVEVGGAGVNVRSTRLGTPLFIAARSNQTHLAKYLLEHGAHPDASFGDETTLTYAAWLSNVELVQLLLVHNVDPNLPEPRSRLTPICVAARVCLGPDAKMVELLLRAKADPLKTSGRATTALTAATDRERGYPTSPSVIKLLLEAGCVGILSPVESPRNECFNNSEFVKYLLNNTDRQGRSALFYAAAGGRTADVAWLLGLGADREATDNLGISVLEVAVGRNHAEIHRLLKGEAHAECPQEIEAKFGENNPDTDIEPSQVFSTCTAFTIEFLNFHNCDVCRKALPDVGFFYHCHYCAEDDTDICLTCLDAWEDTYTLADQRPPGIVNAEVGTGCVDVIGHRAAGAWVTMFVNHGFYCSEVYSPWVRERKLPVPLPAGTAAPATSIASSEAIDLGTGDFTSM